MHGASGGVEHLHLDAGRELERGGETNEDIPAVLGRYGDPYEPVVQVDAHVLRPEQFQLLPAELCRMRRLKLVDVPQLAERLNRRGELAGRDEEVHIAVWTCLSVLVQPGGDGRSLSKMEGTPTARRRSTAMPASRSDLSDRATSRKSPLMEPFREPRRELYLVGGLGDLGSRHIPSMQLVRYLRGRDVGSAGATGPRWARGETRPKVTPKLLDVLAPRVLA